jgi:hypothetical protein
VAARRHVRNFDVRGRQRADAQISARRALETPGAFGANSLFGRDVGGPRFRSLTLPTECALDTATVSGLGGALMDEELEAIQLEDDDPLAHVGDEADAPAEIGRSPDEDNEEGDE